MRWIACALLGSQALAQISGGVDLGRPVTDSMWIPGRGLLLSDDDSFRLLWSNGIQTLLSAVDNESAPDSLQASMRQVRTAFTGHLGDRRLLYALRLAWTDTGANGGAIKDVWLQWDFLRDEDQLSLRVGQAKPRFGIDPSQPIGGLYFTDFASASSVFARSRSRGAWFHGGHDKNTVRWNAGAQNGDVANGAGGVEERGEEADNPNGKLNWVVNASWDPLGDITRGAGIEGLSQGDFGEWQKLAFTLGGGVQVGRDEDRTSGQDVDVLSWNVNTAWMLTGGVTAQADAYWREDDPESVGDAERTRGGMAMVTWTLPRVADSRLRWGVGVRASVVETDDVVTYVTRVPGLDGDPGCSTDYSLVLNLFRENHALKLQMDWTLQHVEPLSQPSFDNHIWRLHFALQF